MKSITQSLFEDRMNAGSARFRLTYSSLWHLARGGTRLAVDAAITILRVVLLLDVSKWQGEIDFQKMKAEGVDGVIIKCGQGSARDPMFLTNMAGAKDQGVPRGSYWFFDSRVDPREQARLWWEWLGHDPGELMHFADYEEYYGGRWKGWQNFKVFLQEFQRLSGLPSDRIGIYTGYYYWIANSPTNATDLAWFRQFRLWLAWYTTNPANVLIPRPWKEIDLILWQYGTNGVDGKTPNGLRYGAQSLEIDENNFYEDEQAYRSYFGLNGGGTPPPDGGSMKYKVLWDGVARRSAPTTSNSSTGFAPYPLGALVDVIEEGISDLTNPSDANKRWVKFADGLYGASNYPDSAGAPKVRMEKVAETPLPVPGATPLNVTVTLSGQGYVTKSVTETLDPE